MRALNDVTFHVAPGETVALLGPNGAGKSTAVDLMLGLAGPDAGEITVLGAAPRRAVAQGRVGARRSLERHRLHRHQVRPVRPQHGRSQRHLQHSAGDHCGDRRQREVVRTNHRHAIRDPLAVRLADSSGARPQVSGPSSHARPRGRRP
ncbi:ATP-binding cassette domain-containing protein [Nonomuraea sp. NPDC003804]|uniref:ATP-binding cassette domain-containing protein n=1 Tax=Nonomuraea sp. NPDC003804 TaxID=3154547 RepID=UPI0033BA870D